MPRMAASDEIWHALALVHIIRIVPITCYASPLFYLDELEKYCNPLGGILDPPLYTIQLFVYFPFW